MAELSTPIKSWNFKGTIAIEGLQVRFLSVSFFDFLKTDGKDCPEIIHRLIL